jgi:hypothetical protein
LIGQRFSVGRSPVFGGKGRRNHGGIFGSLALAKEQHR